MTIFEAVKTTVTPRMAAEHFGLNVSRNGMVCCPFHDDRHPSMKLYEDHYHCFGCQTNGDVIAFTSNLFAITPLEAAQKLAADFGIREDRPSVLAKLKMYTTQPYSERPRQAGQVCQQRRYGCNFFHWRLVRFCQGKGTDPDSGRHGC